MVFRQTSNVKLLNYNNNPVCGSLNPNTTQASQECTKLVQLHTQRGKMPFLTTLRPR